MAPLDSPRRFAYASLATTIFIVYGSLYPFAFHGGSLEAAVQTLLRNHHIQDQPLSGLIANIALYLPLGLFCVAAQGEARPAWQHVLGTTLLGTILCVGLEITQFFDSSRITALTDVYANVAGTLSGALLALPLTRWLDPHVDMKAPERQTAALLLLSYLAYRLFPYVPTLDLHSYWHAVKPALIHPAVHVFAIASYAVIWTVVAALLADLAGRARSRWLIVPAMLAVLAAKMIITHNRLSLSELIALPIALVAWQLLSNRRRKWAGGTLAIPLALVILGDRLLPFDWHSAGHEFGWVPFFSILHGSMATNTEALAEKIFLYSSLVWLMVMAGMRHAIAGALAAAGLFAASVVETHLPGRSAEITDALIALGMAAILAWLAGPVRAEDYTEPDRFTAGE